MKLNNLSATIKSIDYKAFAINHIEKLLVVIALVFFVFILAKSTWQTDQRSPADLSQKLADAESKFLSPTSNPWPDKDREDFARSSDVDEKIKQVLDRISVQDYAFSTDFDFPLYPTTEPAVEPNWLPVNHLIANAGRVQLFQLDPAKAARLEEQMEQLAEAEKEKNDAKKKQLVSDLASEYAISDELLNPPEEQPRSEGGGRGFGRNQEDDEDDRRSRGSQLTDAQKRARRAKSEASEMEGMRFIAVRGVFPIRNQQLELLKAMKSKQMAQKVQMDTLFSHAILERKTAIPGKDPWSGTWERVSDEFHKDIIDHSIGFEPERVNQLIISGDFTMPLPKRVRGSWGNYATHPLVENYKLSDEEISYQMELIENVVQKQLEEYKAEQQAKLNKKGWGNKQTNYAPALRSAARDAGGTDSFIESIAGKTDSEQKDLIKARLRELATAESNLLLFRYFDFSVEPGKVYKYRVRLIVNNPNYREELHRVASPEIADGEFRETPWSKETLPVAVIDDLQYYITKADEGITREFDLPEVSFDCFQWLPEHGTLVNSSFNYSVGDYVRGTKKTEVIKPASKEEMIVKEDAEFSSNDLLLGVAVPYTLDPELHPDLAIKEEQKKRNKGLGSPIMALTTNHLGALKVSDNLSEMNSYERMQTRKEYEKIAYESGGSNRAGLSIGGRRDRDEDEDNPADLRRGGRRGGRER